MNSDFAFFGLPVFLFAIFAVVFGLIFVGVLVFIIVTVSRNAKRVSASGHDPLTLQTDLALKAMDSGFLAPAKSIEERLAETDSLLARGIISPAEHEAARAKIISES